MMEEIFKKHKDAVLFFSGGKDSLSVLLLARPYWDRISVVWVDTGIEYPETYALMEKVKAMVPHFVTLYSDAGRYIQAFGYPVDVVPLLCTNYGQSVWGPKPIRVCSRFDCCNENIWKPMQMYFAITRPSCVIRGDRATERPKGSTQWEGIAFEFPIWDWTDEQVWKYLQENGKGLVEERHCMKHGTSLNCMYCMAQNYEVPHRLGYLKTHHPEVYEASVKFYEKYRQVVMDELNLLKEQK